MQDYKTEYQRWLNSSAIDEKTRAELLSVKDNEKDFKEINGEVVSRVKKAISECFGGYVSEVKDLNESFGKENEEIEMPFDEKVIRLDIPIFGKDNLSDKRESKSEVFIDSDDNNGVLN